MAEIFFSDKELGKAGVPFLVNKDMELLLVPNQWLRYTALVRGRTQSSNTWTTYGYHMLYFFDWLETNNREWHLVISRDLAQYRTSLENSLSARGTPLDINSVHDYLATVVRFYKWAHRENIITSLPFNYELIKPNRNGDPGFFAHLEKSGGYMEIADIVPRKQRREASYISRSQQRILLQDSLKIEDDKILYAFLVSTGVRLEEIANIKLHDIPEDDIFGRTKTYSFEIIGKGKKKRTVYIGHHLLTALLNWRDHARYQLAKKYKNKRGQLPSTFFLNSKGGPLTRKGLWHRVRVWGRKSGIRLTPHIFRHTFGFLYYAKTKDIYGLKKLLGHARISSTEIYTHLDPEEILQSVAELDEEIINIFFTHQDKNENN